MVKNIKKIIGVLCSAVFCAVIAVGVPQMARAAEVEINATNFPDYDFRNYVGKNFDTTNDGKLSEEEITKIIKISVHNVHNNYYDDKCYTNLKGIEYFTALTTLDCSNSSLTELDLSQNKNLTTLNCSNNKLTSLDISYNLTNLDCSYNSLIIIDLSQNKNLTNLDCSHNYLLTLDLSQNKNLTGLDCSYNKLQEIKLNSQTYNKFSLSIYILGALSYYDKISDLQNAVVVDDIIKVIDITKPARGKIKDTEFTIIYVNTPTIPSPSPVIQSGIHIFSDYRHKNPVTGSAIVIYGNGVKKTMNGQNVNNKSFTVYTDILASYKYTLNNNGTIKPSVGKVIVGITKSNIKPEVSSKNKIIDTSASKIAKAKIKNGQITVTAVGKESGFVYLWVIDTGNKGVFACCPIDVKLAPKKLEVQNISGNKLAKNTEIKNGTTLDVYIAGLVGSVKTNDGTYTATVNSKYQSYVTVTPVKGSTNQFTIKAIGLKKNKKTKVTVTFTCDQNNKKTNFSLTLIE